MSWLEERFTTHEGRPLRYLTGGSGPPMLLCHGFIGSAENFDDWFPELLQRRTVVVPDLPGFGKSAPLAARQARRIITLSRHSARDIARLLRVPLDKIAVVPAAPRDVFHRAPDPRAVADVQRRYGRFLLCVGVLAPQKNLERVLRAFAQVRDGATQLVLAGRPAGAYADVILRPLARELDVERRVVFADAPDDETLRTLYHAAVALVYPSLGEGFGLPLVEAMACGCPVLTSNVSSLPEVAGDAALLVDPRDVAAVAGALERLLDAPALRADLVARGRARAALFTWDEAARQTLWCYDEAVRA